jgi:acetolactate decarboxylase
MFDLGLQRARRMFQERWRDVGEVQQVRGAGQLFAGDFSSAATAGEEFAGSRLGLGVMHDLEGEVVSIRGETWRVPVDGRPIRVRPEEGIAFGIAAHGGREHKVPVAPGADLERLLSVIDDFLRAARIDDDHLICAVEVRGHFSAVTLRTVAPPTHDHETLGEIIDGETRFTFDDWHGTLVGFRFPDPTSDVVIPGLHLHGLSADASSGGHVRAATTVAVELRVWVDEFLPLA